MVKDGVVVFFLPLFSHPPALFLGGSEKKILALLIQMFLAKRDLTSSLLPANGPNSLQLFPDTHRESGGELDARKHPSVCF